MTTYIYKSEIVDTYSNSVMIIFTQDGYKNESITVTIKRPRYGKITNFRLYIFHSMVNTYIGSLDNYDQFRKQLLSVMTQEEILNTFFKPVEQLKKGMLAPINPICFVYNYKNNLLNNNNTLGYFFITTGMSAMIATSAFEFTSKEREWLKNDFYIYT